MKDPGYERSCTMKNAQALSLKANILYYTEHTLSNYWFYDPVM